MRTVLIILSAAILVAFADAQRKSNFTKPVINLDKRPRPPVWNRPPEERRKLSIFPKTNMKFVVTPKPMVKNDEEAKEGLPTKRPVMRKFVMQDKSDKGTWSFAPREPLMKSKRFTVTLAPPRIDNFKAIDEMKPDESIKVKTVVESPIPGRELSKIDNLNKGNFIEMVQIKNVNPAESKGPEKIEQKVVGEEIVPELINENNNHDLVEIEVNDNKTLQKSDKKSEDYVIDVWNSNDVNETKYEEENEYDSSNTGQTVTPITPDIDGEPKESRVLDINNIELANDQHDNFSLIVDNQENNNDKVEQIHGLSVLEILLKNNVNDTEEFDINSNYNVNDSLSTTKHETNVAKEDVPLIDVAQPNTFYYVTSLSNNNEKENVKEEGSVVTSIQDTQNIVDSGIASNLKNLMQLIEEKALDIKTDEIYLDNIEARKQIESFIGNRLDIDTVETYTDDPVTNRPIKSDVIDNFMKNYSGEISGESEVSGDLNPVFIDLNSEESFENKSLSSTEMSNESLANDDSNNTSNESNGHSNLTAEEMYIESNTTDEDVTNESIRDASNNYSDELSNGSLIDKSNNLTVENISNESSSNMAAEELSNESIVDKSNNLTEETSNESLNETSNNFTGEEISHESDVVSDEWLSNDSLVGSQEMSIEKISDEALANRFKRSNNIIEEENLATTVSGFKYKGQEMRLNYDLSYKNINA